MGIYGGLALSKPDNEFYKKMVSIDHEEIADFKLATAKEDYERLVQNSQMEDNKKSFIRSQFDLERERESASVRDQAWAGGVNWLKDTMAGALIARTGALDIKGLDYLDDDDFPVMEGYEPSFESVHKTSLELGLNDKELERLFTAKSPEHETAIIKHFMQKRNIEEIINRTLSTRQQVLSKISTILDIDLAVPLGGQIAFARGLTKATRASVAGSVVAYGAVGATKPFLVEDTFEHGVTMQNQVIDALLISSAEVLAGASLLKSVSKNLGESAGAKLGTNEINKNIGAIDQNVKFEDVQKTASDFVQTPKGVQRTTDKIYEAINDLTVKTAQKELDKTAFKAEVSSYSFAGKGIREMFDDVADMINKNPNGLEAKILVSRTRDEITKLFDELVKIGGVPVRTLNKAKRIATKSLDNFEAGVVGKSEKKYFEDINVKMKEIRTNPKKFMSEKVFEPIAEMTKKIDGLSAQLVKLKQEKSILTNSNTKGGELVKANKKIKSKADEIRLAKDELGSIKEKQFSKEKERLVKELEKDGVVLRFDKKKGAYTWKGKVIPAALVIGLFGGTDAFASDGELEGSVFLNGWQSLIVLGAVAFAGRGVYRKMKYTQAVKASIDNAVKANGGIVEQATMLEKVSNAMRGDYLAVRTGFTETFSPLIKYAKSEGNIELKGLIEKMIVDPMNGKSIVAEEIKTKYLYKFNAEYASSEKKLFDEWSKQMGFQISERVTELFTRKHMEQFRELVASAKDGATSVEGVGSDVVKRMAKESDRLLDTYGKNIAKEFGLEGADDMRDISDYLKRAYTESGFDLMRQMTKSTEAIASLKNTFKGMYLSAVSKNATLAKGFIVSSKQSIETAGDISTVRKVLEPMEEMISDVGSYNEYVNGLVKKIESTTDLADLKSSVSKLMGYVSRMDGDSVAEKTIDEYLKTIMRGVDGGVTGAADVSGRFKVRVPLDMSKFQEFRFVQPDGFERTVTLGDIFDRNDYSLATSYMRQLSGRIGLKASGYSVEEAGKIIGRITNQDMKDMASRTLNAIIGNPTYSALGKNQQIVYQALSNMTMLMALPLVALSMAQEMGMLISRLVGSPAEFGRVTDNIVAIIRSRGDDSLMVQQLQDMGLGLNRKGNNIHSRIDLSATETGGGRYLDESQFVNITKTMRDAMFKYVGMFAGADILELGNGVANMRRLYDVAHGKRVLTEAKRLAYGITEKELKTIRKYLKINSKGDIAFEGWDKMPTMEKLEMEGIIKSMGQKGAQRSTIGGTPDWSRDSALGSALSRLVMYPVNSFANLGLHQLRAMSHGDVENTVQIFSGYAGSMIGLKLRDGILGRERSEEDYAFFAMMNLHQMSALSVARSVFSDPAMLVSGGVFEKDLKNMYRAISMGGE